MAFDATRLADYSWADIAKAAKVAMMSAAVGGANYTIDGQSFGRISVEDAKKLYEFAQQMIIDESGTGGGLALVQYGEKV